MYSEVLMSIGTMAEAAEAVAVVDLIEENLYKTKQIDYQQMGLSAAKYSQVRLILGKLSGASDKAVWLRGLRRELKAMSVVRLTVANDPTVQTVNRVVEWVKGNVGVQTVVEWEVDPQLIAGAKVTYGGRWVDRSLALRLAEYWSSYDQRI